MFGNVKPVALAAYVLCGLFVSSANASTLGPMTSPGDYGVTSVETDGTPHAFWLVDFAGTNNADDYWQFQPATGTFSWDGTNATLTGTIFQNTDTANTLQVSVDFLYRSEGAGDEAPKNGGGGVPADWDYFDFVAGSITGSIDGFDVALDLSIRPNGELPGQLGLGANDKDGGLGFSSWIFYEAGEGNEFAFSPSNNNPRIGDINLRLFPRFNNVGPSPVPLPASAWLMIAALGTGAFVARRRRARA